MKIWNDKKIICLLVILFVFSVGYFVIVNRISYAFSPNDASEELYNLTIENIKTSSIEYAKKNPDKFKDDTLIIKVQDLINEKLLVPNEDGSIINPLDYSETLNSMIITIKLKDKKYSVNVEN